MSSRASSNSRNDSSSENEESEQESDEVIQERNRQLLEKYLKSQLELDVMDVDESEQTTEIDVVKVPAVVEEEEEVLPFRLFGTTLQNVKLVDSQENDIVLDPRIRDLTELSSAIKKKRKREFKSIAVEGDWILTSASHQPLSQFSNRVTDRTISGKVVMKPTLAYLNAGPLASIPTTSSNNRRRKSNMDSKPKLEVIPIVMCREKIKISLVIPKKKNNHLSKDRRMRKKRFEQKGLVVKV